MTLIAIKGGFTTITMQRIVDVDVSSYYAQMMDDLPTQHHSESEYYIYPVLYNPRCDQEHFPKN